MGENYVQNISRVLLGTRLLGRSRAILAHWPISVAVGGPGGSEARRNM